MAKNYEEVAMDVIREDWEYRKNLNNSAFNQERIPLPQQNLNK